MQAGASTQDHLISSLAPIPKALGSSAGQSAALTPGPSHSPNTLQEFLEGPDASFPGSYLQRLSSLPLRPLGLVPLWFPSARSRWVCPTWTLNFEGSYWNVAPHWGWFPKGEHECPSGLPGKLCLMKVPGTQYQGKPTFLISSGTPSTRVHHAMSLSWLPNPFPPRPTPTTGPDDPFHPCSLT